ncbi:MAG: hypothetical protein RBS78_04735 [Coriobacteriia bacterium]|jgi:hypothetical protein|nr:hypothetical protein [Coriobacteriia bacterium]
MRRILFTAALVAVLVFAFSGVAFAKYAGYAYNTPVPPSTDPNPAPGYLSWQGANVIAAQQGGDNGSTAHGGYAVNTTKCAVCHSVHRAASDLSAAGVGSYWKLTPAGQACTACHTPSGANPVSTALVEWPSTYDDGGPHRTFNCLNACHGSVHGANQSAYAAAAAFNLTARNDAAITAAVGAGNVKANTVDAATLAGNFSTLTPTQKAANRAMVTGYTCGASGCHSSSQFAVNADGYGDLRASDPRASTTLDKVMTGHGTAGATNHCSTGGCHQAIGNQADSKCASCHDMVGKATNSSAFPHANRSITVWEWTRPAGVLTQTEKDVEAGNLWMYAGDVTYRDASGQPTDTVMWDGQTGLGITHGTAVGGLAPNRINTRTVIEGSTAWHETPGNINDGTCLKCHGYQYWPLWDTTHAGDRSFANR